MQETVINYTKTHEDGTKEPGQVIVNFPSSIQEACQMWGEDVVLSKALQAVTIDIQRICRGCNTPEEAQTVVNSWVPGVARQRVSGVSERALIKALKGRSKAELIELFKAAGIDVNI